MADPATEKRATREARAAWRHGQAALRKGETEQAVRWLDRACRLAPRDPVLRLALAGAWLGLDAAAAAEQFQALSAWHGVREVWLGLAAARLALGDRPAARAALHMALRRFAAPEDGAWEKLADRIAPDGWCAMTASGEIRRGPAGSVARRDIPGAPLDTASILGQEPTPHGPRPRAARQPPTYVPARRPADIVIPVYADIAATRACLDSVLAARPRGARLVVIDDASPEPALAALLDRLATRRRITLIRHPSNLGFPAAANAGLRLARTAGRDALLLNADILVAPGFVERLRDVAYAGAANGTVCPLSNNATILSYPEPAGDNAMPDQAETQRLAELAWKANGRASVEIPTAVGFCMYLRHDCLAATGLFDAARFGRGYGEENDFSRRAATAGWRHVATPGVFVAHRGEASFGPSGARRARAMATLIKLHPDYPARLSDYVAADPLAPARARLDLARWRASRPRGAPAVLLVSHAMGGGVARSVAARGAALRADGLWPVELQPAAAGLTIEGYPNLRLDIAGLRAALRGIKLARVEFHHLLGHAAAVRDLPRLLGVPYQVHAHDYHWLCPRLVLSGEHGRYCGEPDEAGCVACIRRRGNLLDEEIGVATLRARSAALLRDAAEVIAPSADVAARLGRYFPNARPRVIPPSEVVDRTSAAMPPSARRQGWRRVAVIGAIGPEKGFDILLALAQEAASSQLRLEFVLIGHSVNDAALLRTGHVFITGPYRPEEAVALIRAQRADIALLPSIVPETWCHALSEAWAAGLAVVAFDLGAQAERISAAGRGELLPLGMAAAAINRRLLAARS